MFLLGVFQVVGDVIMKMTVVINLMKLAAHQEIVQNTNFGIIKY